MKIKAQKRDVAGKKVKNLRALDLVPASVYGPKKPSTSIQVNKKDFIKLFKTVGYNRFFDLEVDDVRPAKVLVKEIQKNPVTDKLLSISFYQVDEDRKITVEVPVHFNGEAPAVKLNLGFLIHQLSTIALHCLPKDLPNEIVVDLNTLEKPGDAITVADIVKNLGEGVELDSSMELSTAIVSIVAPQKEEEVAPTPVESEEGAATEGAEGEAAKVEEKSE